MIQEMPGRLGWLELGPAWGFSTFFPRQDQVDIERLENDENRANGKKEISDLHKFYMRIRKIKVKRDSKTIMKPRMNTNC